MATALAHPKLISLAAGFTDHETLPTEEARVLLSQMLGSRHSGEAALQYGSTAGDPLLRRLTAERFRALDRAPAKHPAYSTERILITNGSQQMLYIIAEALCDPGDIVLVEDPTYFVFLGIVQSHGLRARGIRMEQDGLELAHLEKVLEQLKRSGELRRVKLLYLVSYFQNPTGRTTSYEKKRAALKLLRRYERSAGHPLYLLEDGAYRELRFNEKDVASALTAPEARERVIYTGTYSKPFATGIRVGYSFLPERLLAPALHIKGNHDFGTSNLLQQLLARALAGLHYEKHVEKLRRRYHHKSEVMLEALGKHLPKEVKWEVPGGGLYVWVQLPAALKSGMNSRLFKSALAEEVLYVPGELCYAEDASRRRPSHEMRLSFGAASEKAIREGIGRLGNAVRRTLG